MPPDATKDGSLPVSAATAVGAGSSKGSGVGGSGKTAGGKIGRDDVRHVAKLARLALPEAKLERLTSQLESILSYVAQISRVDVSGVEPIAHALPLRNVLREDVVEPSLPLEKVLANAPDTDGPFFKVPKVIGAEEDSAG
jgi:aspartyl-tRNA(Asn)/glutamyl-tRNA(Gln) amidotransferase subunit C